MKRQFLVIAVFAVSLMQSVSANAALHIVSSVGGAPKNGVNYVTFDKLTLGGSTTAHTKTAVNDGASADLDGFITVSFTPDAQAVQGSLGGKYAAPYVSGANGVNFGQTGPAAADATPYITTGSYGNVAGASVTMSFSDGAQKYFGLLWGSVDDYNKLEFFSGATSLGAVDYTQVNPTATGDQGINGTFYVNINSDTAFDRVVATSSKYAFEFDNVAYGETPFAPVPEPTAMLVWSILAGSGCGLAAIRRRRGWSQKNREQINQIFQG